MSFENPNKKIIEDFIADAVALLEQEGEAVMSLLNNISVNTEYKLTNRDGVTFTYIKMEDSPDNFIILAKSDLMQEYHRLPDGSNWGNSDSE